MEIYIDEIRKKRGLSIRQLSYMTGIKKSTLQDILQGKKAPRLDTAEKLAYCLKVAISDLYNSPLKFAAEGESVQKALYEYAYAFRGQNGEFYGREFEQ